MFVDLKLQPDVRASGAKVSEDQEQAWLIQWAKRNAQEHPELDLLFAIPNGGHRHRRQAALLKLTGVRAGVPDLFLPAPRGESAGLWIELKAMGRGARPTPEQKRWLARLQAQGYAAQVCHGFEAARDAVLAYLAQPSPSPAQQQ